MSRIHIALVGGQPMPVYLGIKYCQPDKVLFVYSKESERQKQTLKNEIIKNEIIKAENVLKSSPLNPVNMEEIESFVIDCKEKFKNYELSINISSGTKAWAYYFSKIFEDVESARIFYIDQNNNVYDLKAKTQEKIESDILVQFKLNKNSLRSFVEFESFTEKDFETIKKIEAIRETNIGVFNKLTTIKDIEIVKKQNKDYWDDKSCLNWNKNGTCEISIDTNTKSCSESLSSPNLWKLLFNAGWFEVKVAKIFVGWNKAKHIYMNCKFLVNNDMPLQLAEKYPKNEIDIIIDTGEKALFVECKTTISDSTDIEKFSKAVEIYGGKGSKAIFICLNKFGDKEREKIRDCNMLSYSFAESKDINELYDMLDRKIDSINK